MNDDQVCIAVLRPMREHVLVRDVYDRARARVDGGHALDPRELQQVAENPMLSSGERALFDIALGLRAWHSLNVITLLGAMSPAWQHHVLAMLVARLNLNPTNAGDGLGWVDAYDDGTA